ncbi:MAG: ABC transporter substrate-binding protein [Chloroflexi bacterium]|nr:ABC transporter substrate-binding protein [Chloroflexota bacterium]
MRKKVVWMMVSGLVTFSLVMAACAKAPATPTKPATPTAVTTTAPTTTSPTEKPAVTPTVEKPKYGGTFIRGLHQDILDFDDLDRQWLAYTLMVTNETPLVGDWTRGPAGGYGTNEAGWDLNSDRWELKTGLLAESWEIPNKIEGDSATFVFKIRKGVFWGLNPNSEASRLVNGRELTAEDVAFSLNLDTHTPQYYLYKTLPEVRNTKITAPDKWTVKVENIPWTGFEGAFARMSDFIHVVPPEVVQKYGNMRDWKVSVGTGPYILTDFVPSSSATLVKNTKYWMKDPIGPGKGNQLPYMDGVKFLIITDRSTRYAALRTGKVDWVTTVDWEEAARLKKDYPLLKQHQYFDDGGGTYSFGMRIDKPPFTDIRVRRALMMATDFEGIKKNLYGGNAQILTWPIGFFKEYAGAYLGLDDPDTPASVKELYAYNPEKAKVLLKEAGYPNGFKTWIDMGNTPEEVDYMSLIKSMWAKVGVDLELRPKEAGALRTIRAKFAFEQMMDGLGAGRTSILYRMLHFRGMENPENSSRVDDPVVERAFQNVQSAVVTSQREADRQFRELMKYVVDQAWVIPGVTPPTYTVWWPWIKNYNGETAMGYMNRHVYNWIWLDQELKKSMGY